MPTTMTSWIGTPAMAAGSATPLTWVELHAGKRTNAASARKQVQIARIDWRKGAS